MTTRAAAPPGSGTPRRTDPRARRVRIGLAGAAALGVVGLGGVLIGTSAASSTPEVGDCLQEPGTGGVDLPQVDCGSDDARYEVVGVDDVHRVGWDEFYSGSTQACSQFTGVDLRVPVSVLDQDAPEVRSDVLCLRSVLTG